MWYDVVLSQNSQLRYTMFKIKFNITLQNKHELCFSGPNQIMFYVGRSIYKDANQSD